MSPVIKVGRKPASKKSSGSVKKSSGTTRKSSSKATTGRKAAAAKAKPRKATKAKGRGGPRGPRTPKTDPKVLARHLKELEKAGAARKKAALAHEEAVNAVNDAAIAALEDEVPMTLISDTVGVSRQWLYKMGGFRDRTNGNGRKKAKATSASRKKAAPKKSVKSSAKKGRRVRTAKR